MKTASRIIFHIELESVTGILPSDLILKYKTFFSIYSKILLKSEKKSKI